MSYWRVALRQLLKLRQLYYFYRVTECKPNDLDPVITPTFSIIWVKGRRRPPIVRCLIQIIEEQTEETCDKYYASRFTFYYFLSRNHAAGIRDLVR